MLFFHLLTPIASENRFSTYFSFKHTLRLFIDDMSALPESLNLTSRDDYSFVKLSDSFDSFISPIVPSIPGSSLAFALGDDNAAIFRDLDIMQNGSSSIDCGKTDIEKEEWNSFLDDTLFALREDRNFLNITKSFLKINSVWDSLYTKSFAKAARKADELFIKHNP